jgi:hypothetical protein
MVLEHNFSAYKVAQNLSIPESTITCWVRESGRQYKENLIGNGNRISQSQKRACPGKNEA